MSDEALAELAWEAGISVDWVDAAKNPRRVSAETLRSVLTALQLPCGSPRQIEESRAHIAHEREGARLLTVAHVDLPFVIASGDANGARTAKLRLENGETYDIRLGHETRGWTVPAIREIGYHSLEIDEAVHGLAVVPDRCFTIDEIAPGARLWGATAQIYGLRRDGDGGIGDFGGVIEYARELSSHKADALALSPIHAQSTKGPQRYRPYTPSSRIFLNPLHADPALVLGAERVAAARTVLAQDDEARDLEGAGLIDWPRAAALKLHLFRLLFAEFCRFDLDGEGSALGADFRRFCSDGGSTLNAFLLCEAEPEDQAFTAFQQWLADRGLAATQRTLRENGMRIGLIADIAVGLDPAGAESRMNPDMVNDLTIGAPPDLFNAAGQNWGLVTHPPRNLIGRGFEPFLQTIRANMKHGGGIRIDHAMGLMRLWMVPDGASAADGAYVANPLDELLGLIALESWRHRAIVIGEDLGTVPAGFRERLRDGGMLGMSVLWFEQDADGFTNRDHWRVDSAAMSSTHDLPTVAGWWRGEDIAARAEAGAYASAAEVKRERLARQHDRGRLWRALVASGVGADSRPKWQSTEPVVDAALRFVAATPSRLALLPLDDLLGVKDQPNLPGTVDEHPNWRRRQAGPAREVMRAPAVATRLATLEKERGRR